MAFHKYQNENHIKTEQSCLRKGAYVGFKTLATIDQSLLGCRFHREQHVSCIVLSECDHIWRSNDQAAVDDSHYLK
jgi:hypothetical protein